MASKLFPDPLNQNQITFAGIPAGITLRHTISTAGTQSITYTGSPERVFVIAIGGGGGGWNTYGGGPALPYCAGGGGGGGVWIGWSYPYTTCYIGRGGLSGSISTTNNGATGNGVATTFGNAVAPGGTGPHIMGATIPAYNNVDTATAVGGAGSAGGSYVTYSSVNYDVPSGSASIGSNATNAFLGGAGGRWDAQSAASATAKNGGFGLSGGGGGGAIVTATTGAYNATGGNGGSGIFTAGGGGSGTKMTTTSSTATGGTGGSVYGFNSTTVLYAGAAGNTITTAAATSGYGGGGAGFLGAGSVSNGGAGGGGGGVVTGLASANGGVGCLLIYY